MFVQGKNLLFSLILHILLLLGLYFFFLYKTPSLSLLPKKRVVTLTVEQRKKAVTPAPPRETTPPPVQERDAKREEVKETVEKPSAPVERVDPPVVDAPPETKESSEAEEKALSPPDEKERSEPSEESVSPPEIEPVSEPEPVKEEVNQAKIIGESFSYSREELPPLVNSETPSLPPAEDFFVEDLLITEEKSQEGTDSLYSIELDRTRDRRIMEIPEMVFDLNDPVLGTLADCRIGFTVTEEGIVREIEMIPPGTGSETYDEILENILSRFLFTPGERERGVIAINFSHISGEES